MRITKTHYYFWSIVLFVFHPVIETLWGPFKYFDEVFVLVTFVAIFASNGKKLFKSESLFFIEIACIILIGLVGNIISISNQIPRAIIQDLLSYVKFPLFAITIPHIMFTEKQKIKLADMLSCFIRALFLIMFFTSVASLFLNIGLSSGSRYGIRSYKFIYDSPAVLNAYYYLFMVIFSITITKNGKIRKNSTLFLIIGLIPWLLTLRSRAIAFSAVYLIIYISIIRFRNDGIKYRFKWYHILLFAVLVLLLSWNAIEKYFIDNDRVARYLLLHTSIEIAKDNFPLGTGFGTFGTEASRAFYSNIYSVYGLSRIYGLNEAHATFVTDQYWFAVLGQFGFSGLVLFGILIGKLLRRVWKVSNNGRGNQIAGMTMIFTYLFGSLTAPTFIQAAIIPCILVIYFLRQETI